MICRTCTRRSPDSEPIACDSLRFSSNVISRPGPGGSGCPCASTWRGRGGGVGWWQCEPLGCNTCGGGNGRKPERAQGGTSYSSTRSGSEHSQQSCAATPKIGSTHLARQLLQLRRHLLQLVRQALALQLQLLRQGTAVGTDGMRVSGYLYSWWFGKVLALQPCLRAHRLRARHLLLPLVQQPQPSTHLVLQRALLEVRVPVVFNGAHGPLLLKPLAGLVAHHAHVVACRGFTEAGRSTASGARAEVRSRKAMCSARRQRQEVAAVSVVNRNQQRRPLAASAALTRRVEDAAVVEGEAHIVAELVNIVVPPPINLGCSR